MSRPDFIRQIAPAVIAECRSRGLSNAQAWTCISQACCESANGTSELAQKARALFGIKAASSWQGATYRKETKECYDGKTYTVVTAVFRAYASFEESIRDYFDFLSGSRYRASLTAQTVQECVGLIKAGGYATAPTYVNTITGIYHANRKLIESYRVEDKKMGIFSRLCTKIYDFGTKHSNPRSQDGIKQPTKLIVHHMAGVMGALECAKYHLHKTSDTNGASASYYIKDEEIVGGVSEDRRPWTSGGTPKGAKSGRWADFRAITVEVSNNKNGIKGSKKGWTVSDKSYRSLVRLFADVCKRYGITPHYDGTQNGTLCMHSQFANTGCPGEHLEQLITSGQLERDILAEMGQKQTQATTPAPATAQTGVRFRAQVGAFKTSAAAERQLATLKEKNLTGKIVHEGQYYKVQHPKDGFTTRGDAELSAGALRKMGYPGSFVVVGT